MQPVGGSANPACSLPTESARMSGSLTLRAPKGGGLNFPNGAELVQVGICAHRDASRCVWPLGAVGVGGWAGRTPRRFAKIAVCGTDMFADLRSASPPPLLDPGPIGLVV